MKKDAEIPPKEMTILDVHDIITMLKTAHANQSRLIALADQKANALIGVLAVVFTILFTKAQQLAGLPLISQLAFLGFLIAEISGIVFALLVIFPKNITGKQFETPSEMPNPLFFGIYTQFKEQEYVDYITSQLSSGLSARKLLLTDYYQIGTVLKHKYSQLRRAYLFAVSGFGLLLLGLIATFVAGLIG